MTEYSNAVNCSRTFGDILVIGNKKSLGLTAKHIKLNSETDHFQTNNGPLLKVPISPLH